MGHAAHVMMRYSTDAVSGTGAVRHLSDQPRMHRCENLAPVHARLIKVANGRHRLGATEVRARVHHDEARSQSHRGSLTRFSRAICWTRACSTTSQCRSASTLRCCRSSRNTTICAGASVAETMDVYRIAPAGHHILLWPPLAARLRGRTVWPHHGDVVDEFLEEVPRFLCKLGSQMD